MHAVANSRSKCRVLWHKIPVPGTEEPFGAARQSAIISLGCIGKSICVVLRYQLSLAASAIVVYCIISYNHECSMTKSHP